MLLCAVGLSLVGAVPAQATSEGHGYLALGDSVAFGTDPNRDPRVASNMVGYPDYVASMLNIGEVNASCPGEATGGFISLTGLDNVCRPYRFFFNLPLHVSYSGSQLAFAESYLEANPRTRLVTIDLGANDVFVLEGRVCGGDPACIAAGLPTTLANIEANLETIFKGLRATGYTGLIVALTYYSLQYPDTTGAQALNAPIITAAQKYGVFIADGLAAFAGAASAPANPPGAAGTTCAAGLTIVDLTTSPISCNVHPTQLGHQLLAKAIVKAIAASCQGSAIGCLDRNRAA